VASECRIKHFQIISVHDTLALLVLVLQDGTIRQQMVSLPEPAVQEELTTLANRLNTIVAGLTTSQVEHRVLTSSPLEALVIESLTRLMEAADRANFTEFYLDGLRNVLSQPEFANSKKLQRLLEVLEDKRSLQLILSQVLRDDGIKVIIGSENPDDAMRDCTVVLARYGLAGEAVGAAGILGPTRLEYGRAIPVVRYVANLMSEIMREIRG
jgi:heat-inducible transcriptional repressor